MVEVVEERVREEGYLSSHRMVVVVVVGRVVRL
jgi:hypothetical protein